METNEVKNQLEGIAKEVKGDVKNLEAKLEKSEAVQVEMQKSFDKLTAEVKKSQIGAAASVEKKDSLETRIEAKSAELKTITKGQKAVEIKASVDMLRTVLGNSQSLITAGPTVSIPPRISHVRDFMRIGKLSTPVYIFDVETARQGSPAITAEGARKPQISFALTQKTATAAKIAAYYKISTELAHDSPAFAYSLQGKGVEMTLQYEDNQILYGSGTNGEMSGLMTNATPFSTTLQVKNAQVIDVIRAAVNQVRLSQYAANVVLMNPTDVAALELTKDSQGRYILPNLLTAGAPSSVSRVQIAEIDQVNPGEFLVAALDLAVDAFTVEDLVIKTSDSNEDDFVTNKLTVVIEERLILAVTRPAALVKGTFSDAINTLSGTQPKSM